MCFVGSCCVMLGRVVYCSCSRESEDLRSQQGERTARGRGGLSFQTETKNFVVFKTETVKGQEVTRKDIHQEWARGRILLTPAWFFSLYRINDETDHSYCGGNGGWLRHWQEWCNAMAFAWRHGSFQANHPACY